GLRRHCRQHRANRSGQQRPGVGHHADRSSRIFVLEPRAKASFTHGQQTMIHKHSDYMHWAKTQSRARYNLATSGVGPFPLDELDPDCVVSAFGTSMANYVALATMLEPGDEVLLERPTYGLIVDALRYIGATLTPVERRRESGWAVDLDEIILAITPKTKLIVITNLHNPSSVLTPEPVLEKIGDIAREAGARVLVDEVYLDAVYEDTPRTSFYLGP